jgi:UDP-N-acetylmuramoylalanine--D-glutamate ligase
MEKGLIVVLGAGESGVGAAMLAQKQGFDVFVSDFGVIPSQYKTQLEALNVPFEEQQHTASKILEAIEVIKSPGIPDTVAIIKEIKSKEIPVISEIEFAKRYTTAKTVCITGSNGKTTTTMLTYHILKNAGLNVGLAGNIGHSFAAQVATADFDWYVLELSSFMLDDMHEFKADIAVLLNITPDHLDRYDYKLGNYAASKMRITRNQSADDVFIYCADDEETIKVLKKNRINAKAYPFSIRKKVENGAYLEGDQLHININLNDQYTMSISELALQGKHNIYNSMAAIPPYGRVWKILRILNIDWSLWRKSMV